MGSTGVPLGFARLEFSPGSPNFSPGQIVNGRVAQLGPKGAVIEIADRLATIVTDLDLAVGELVQLSVKEVSKDQTLLQLVGREGFLLSAQMSSEPQLAQLIASYRLPVDRPHLNAARKLLARGLPVTPENLERLARAEQPKLLGAPDLETTDSVLTKLIESYDMPADRPHLYAARQLLARGLPVSRENVEQLTRTLARFGATAEADFQAATYLQASGLPLTRSTLAVIRSSLENPALLGQQVHQLQQTLSWLAELLESLTVEKDLSQGEFRRLVKGAAQQLSQRIVQADGEDRAALVESLRRVFKDQGTSLENRLARVLSGDLDPAELEGDLRFLLTRLAQMVSADRPPVPQRTPEAGLVPQEAGRVSQESPPEVAPSGGGPDAAAAGKVAAGATEPEEPAALPPGTEDGEDPAELVASPSGAQGAAEAGEEVPVGRGKAEAVARPGAAPLDPAGLEADGKVTLPGSPELQRALVHLQRAGPELAEALQVQQLRNSAQPRDPSEQWLAFQVPLSGLPGEPPRTVELRISRRPNRKVDPGGVRLRLRLDLPRLERVEVRLELLGKQIKCHLASSSGASLPVLREEFSSLQGGLERLGYTVGAPGFGMLAAEPDPTEIAVEVPEQLPQIDVRA